jgi:hypothetical protein
MALLPIVSAYTRQRITGASEIESGHSNGLFTRT